MATIRLAFTTPHTGTNAKYFQTTDKYVGLNRIMNLVGAAIGKAGVNGPVTPGNVAVAVDENTTQASGTVTCITVANASTVTIGNVVLTSNTGTPSAGQWKCGVSATADAAALTILINTTASLNSFVVATSVAGVVTIKSKGQASGALGNFIHLVSSDGTNLAVVAFSGGAADTGAATYAF